MSLPCPCVPDASVQFMEQRANIAYIKRSLRRKQIRTHVILFLVRNVTCIDIRRSCLGMVDDNTVLGMLSPGIRKWIGWQGWNSLRDIQRQSIDVMLGHHDKTRPNVVISAPTSSGKTEAAFIPALSIVEEYLSEHRDSSSEFVQVLYVAPLKALINDQYRRMSEMASYCGVPVYLWHGDAPQGQKTRLLKRHDGVLMTTPESLESFLMNRGKWCAEYLRPLVVVVDEFHAFLGEGRGKQLMSLLSRIDAICDGHGAQHSSRIALSATLSELDTVANILSPDDGAVIIDGTKLGNDKSELSITTYEPALRYEGGGGDSTGVDYVSMAKNVISGSGMDKTLTFCRSRSDVETMTTCINDELNRVRSGPGDQREAFPHHGLLSRQTREELEYRLVATDKPTMAVATITLELGIDIGDIAKVYQVEAASSVASVRQRMGRSGRRNGVRSMHIMSPLSEEQSDMQDDLVTNIAEVELMNHGWFEPPNDRRRDMSVFGSEVLSLIVQCGSAYPDELYSVLCEHGAFRNVSDELCGDAINDMVDNELLYQSDDGRLMIGAEGEKEVSDWHFYATFADQECYTVQAGKRVIGQVTPPETALQELARGGIFKLAGKYWKVINMSMDSKVLSVTQTSKRGQFLTPMSSGCGDGVNGRIKQMKVSLLHGKMAEYEPSYVDEQGLDALAEARLYAAKHRLNGLGLSIFDNGDIGSDDMNAVQRRLAAGFTDDAVVKCVPPVSMPAFNAIVSLMRYADDEACDMTNVPLYRLNDLVNEAVDAGGALLGHEEELVDDTMLKDIRGREKNNHFFGSTSLRLAYGQELIDIPGALKWLNAFQRFWSLPVQSRNR